LGNTVQRTQRADRFHVVVHVDAERLVEGSESGQSVLGDGMRVSAETSRRLACDCTRVVMTHDAAGNTLDVGRKTRTVPAPIRRALEHRDSGRCRFPGCTNRICDAHHIRHWSDGGETKLANLILLCTAHHKLVHEGGFRALPGDEGEVRFVRPDGEAIAPVPEPRVLICDPVETLVRENVLNGVAIDAWTAPASPC
jgi:hypothetical protein